jgi:nucleoid-associated protein YgaU
MKLFYIALIVLLTQASWAQENGATEDRQGAPGLPQPQSVQYPAVRPRPPDDPNKESSSFIGDPENIDPLNSRRDNLKDDAEPVLEDIRQVLDAPPPTKKEEPEGFQASSPQAAPKKKPVAKKATAKKNKKAKLPKKVKTKVVRKVDDPDEAIERSFHNNYMRYNSEPTSVEAWSTATFGRSEEVYIVQKGDTLWSISETLFGDSLFWPKIWALNRQGIVNPHFITPGMKVRFFPGSPDYVPTLSVGGEPGAGEFSANGELNENGFVSSDGSNSTSQASSAEGNEQKPNPLEYGEFTSSEDRKLPSQGVLVAAAGEPTPLPPSLPVHRSSRYFDPARKIEVIELKDREKLYVQPQVDVFLTDRLVLSDLKIARLGNNDLGCNIGEVVKDFEFIRKTPTDEYTILEPQEKIVIEKNKLFLYPYRKVGTLAQYAEGKLRIKDCVSEINRTHLFVPTSVVNGLKTRKVSDKQPRIIGGAALMDQQIFHQDATIFIDMGSINYEVGQTFGLISERLDAPAGHFKIMDSFGSYAVGIITNEIKPIMSGDRVVTQ